MARTGRDMVICESGLLIRDSSPTVVNAFAIVRVLSPLASVIEKVAKVRTGVKIGVQITSNRKFRLAGHWERAKKDETY